MKEKSKWRLSQSQPSTLIHKSKVKTIHRNRKHKSLDTYTEEDERRMNIIGQNGNTGEHYEE